MNTIEIRSVLDYPAYRDYFFHQLKRMKRMRTFFYLSIGVFVLMLGSLVLTLLTAETVQIMDFVPLAVLIAVYALYFVFFFVITKRSYDKNKETFTFVTRYRFLEEDIVIGTDDKAEAEGVHVRYDQLHEIIETQKYFYLYMDPQRCYIMRKDSFIQGSVRGLRTLLKAKFTGPYLLKSRD